MSASVLTLTTSVPGSRARLWTGRTLSALTVVFLLFDGLMKVIKEPHVIQASADLGLSANTIDWIGALLLACTALYAIPRTAVFGAMLLTGYLGGAVASNVRAGHDVFQTVFPIVFATIAWAGLFLREPRLGELMPLRKEAQQ